MNKPGNIIRSQEIAVTLCEQLKLDVKKIRRMTLTIDATELPTLAVEFLIRTDDAERIKQYVEQFSLVPKNDNDA